MPLPYIGRGRKLDLIALLPALKERGLGRRTLDLMEQKAIQAALSDRAGGGNVWNYYDAMWHGGRCPQKALEPLLKLYGACAKCGEPRFDNYTGKSGAEYCSDNCAYEASDEDEVDYDYYGDEDPDPELFEDDDEFALTPEESFQLEMMGDDIPGMEAEPGWGA